MDPDKIPELPESFELIYLNEGAANIVYRIVVPRPPSPRPEVIDLYSDTTPPPSILEQEEQEPEEQKEAKVDLSIFENKLLRLRKDLPTTMDVYNLHGLWLTLIQPGFTDDEVVHQQLVKIKLSRFASLNEELRTMEANGTRNAKRAGVYLADEYFGLIITDMTPSAQGNDIVLEIKPKWLAQSPTAPPGSARCRQCALNDMRNYYSYLEDGPLLRTFCPLDLVSGDVRDVYNAVNIILPPSQRSIENQAHLLNWFFENELLPKLRFNQTDLDRLGPLRGNPLATEHRIAMTLRDCTLYIRMDRNKVLEARIGDLDVKCSKKEQYWRDTEWQLLKEGWYTGKDPWFNDLKVPINCRLSRPPPRAGQT